MNRIRFYDNYMYKKAYSLLVCFCMIRYFTKLDKDSKQHLPAYCASDA